MLTTRLTGGVVVSQYRGLYLTRVPLPDAATTARWKCEAIKLGFNRSVVLRLCFARWLYRDVYGIGPERDLRRERE